MTGNNSVQSRSLKGLLQIFCIVVFLFSAVFLLAAFQWEPSHAPVVTPELLKTEDGNYAIVFASVKTESSVYGVHFIIRDENLSIICSDYLGNIYERDSRFLNENFTPSNFPVVYHDADADISVSKNDSIIVVTKQNGGIAESGMSFELLYRANKKERIFELIFDDTVTVPEYSPLHSAEPPVFKVSNATEHGNPNLTISSSHFAFSSPRFVFICSGSGIGVTLISNSTQKLENITVEFTDADPNCRNQTEVIFKRFTNLTLNENSSFRIVFFHVFDNWWGEHIITVKIKAETWEKSVVASAPIEILYPPI